MRARFVTSASWALLVVGSVGALAALASATHPDYGYFNDEFYYLSCAKRPAFGYVDHPPFAPWVLAASRSVLGDSLLAIRLLPALCGGALVFVTGVLARQLGAGLWGQLIAAVCILATPMTLASSGFFSMNCFGPLFWALGCYLIIRIIRTQETHLWLAFGLLSGVALLNKHAYALFLVALFVGLLATPLRWHLGERRLWLGAGVTALCQLPSLAWQAIHGWPSAEFYQHVAGAGGTPALGRMENQAPEKARQCVVSAPLSRTRIRSTWRLGCG